MNQDEEFLTPGKDAVKDSLMPMMGYVAKLTKEFAFERATTIAPRAMLAKPIQK